MTNFKGYSGQGPYAAKVKLDIAAGKLNHLKNSLKMVVPKTTGVNPNRK
jgi:hypothetical protein